MTQADTTLRVSAHHRLLHRKSRLKHVLSLYRDEWLVQEALVELKMLSINELFEDGDLCSFVPITHWKFSVKFTTLANTMLFFTSKHCMCINVCYFIALSDFEWTASRHSKVAMWTCGVFLSIPSLSADCPTIKRVPHNIVNGIQA